MAQVVMFVLNDVRRDARVLREAATLAAAGHGVTVIGRPSRPDDVTADQETRDGFTIVRVPVPGGWRRALLEAGGGRSAAGPSAATGPAGPARSILRVLVDLVRWGGRLPILGTVVRGADVLVRWRFGIVAWGTAAAAAAPAADIWHAHDLTGLPAALAARSKRGGRLIYDAHELYTEAGDTATRPRWAKRVLRRYERRAIRSADAVIAVNGGLAAALHRIGVPRRLVVVHNAPSAPPAGRGTAGARTMRARSPLRAAAGGSEDTPLAIYHGSFAVGRGVEVVIAALREPAMAGVHGVFLGEGAGGDGLRIAAADPGLGGRVHVLPPVDPAAVTSWVAGADVGVMPIAPTTRNHRLSTPNKLFECLAAGVPVVASDFPGIRQIVDADPEAPLGALVDPMDPAAVARAILSIVDAPASTRRALRERCLEAARTRWSWEIESAALLRLYADLAPAGAAVARPGSPAGTTAGDAPGVLASPVPVPQRVTFVLPSSGAYDSRTRRMALGLGARGHDVLVIARTEAGLPGREDLAPGVVLRRVDAGEAQSAAASPASANRRGSLLREGLRMLRTAATARRQAAAARTVDRPAALYHAMGFLGLPVAIDLARRVRAPFLYDARDLYVGGNNIARLPAPLRSIFAVRERTWARRAAAVLTVNGSLAAELERRLGVPRPTVVLNAQAAWVPPASPPDRLRRALGLSPGTPLILYHGGFMPDRGLAELIAAIREPGLEAAHLALMGSGTMEPEIRHLAADPAVAGRVHVLPPVPPSALLDWVASADVGAMPNQPRTLNERLSTPNKLFECLAAGTPVVSSDFPERRRIIIDDPEGPLGAVCDPTDPASIAGALRSILELGPSAMTDLRARCRRASSARYDWATQLEILVALYGKVTGRAW